MTTLGLRKSIDLSPLRLAFFLIPLVLTCFALSPTARAVCQNGCGTNNNTFLGDNALISNTTGSALVYSTYLGGNSDAVGNGIALDASTNAYVTGSHQLPHHARRLPATNGGGYDVFVAKFSAPASNTLYVTNQGSNNVSAYTIDAIDPNGAFANPAIVLIGIGMWLGTIMWFNVWFVIWPNQQKALNIGNAFPDLPAAEKAKAARTAGMFSRTNTMLSVPMLFCMVAAPHLA